MAFTVFGSPGANSYAAVASADTYLGDRYGYSTWTALTSTAKQQILVTVTTILETMNWDGTIVSATQDLAFPRTGLVDRKGATVSDSVVPPEVLSALYLGAGELAATRWDLTGVKQSVTSVSDGTVSVAFGGGLIDVPGIDHGIPRVMYDQIAHLLAGSQNGMRAGAAYGTKDSDGDTVESSFPETDLEAYGTHEPL